MKVSGFMALLLLAGCASVREQAYQPHKSAEKKAFARVDRTIGPDAVRANYVALAETELAWAGIIKDVQYNETERTFQVAFEIEYHDFDWVDHGGGQPFRLSAEGGGIFTAGWYASKPTRISYLKLLAAPGDMIIVYGKPFSMANGVIQLAATAIRPVKQGGFSFLEPIAESAEPPVVDEGVPEASGENHREQAIKTLESLEAL
ncbi:hypothetical protein PDESU_04102 [Pontiella desulfatans]|uniref:Lipoprotein n=1 Tax=Pontiella desulfatans TaxID=2750659 RepID=A0A6C2U6P2_PONDE|nr:hypothetical protein [Pontiella desulfatans]VGO15519.1 hypothetical protein PDESU_04102 [Pontiella desulfatans]